MGKESSNLIKLPELPQWLEDAGYKGVSSFGRSERCVVSFETARRAYGGGGISVFSAYMLMVSLNLPTRIIKKKLEEVGDKLIAPRLAEGTHFSDHRTQAMVEAVDILFSSSSNAPAAVASLLRPIASTLGVDIEPQLRIMEGRKMPGRPKKERV